MKTVQKLIQHPAWTAKKLYLHGRSFLNLNKDDIILAVFPKTGSTWVRFFLFNLLSSVEQRQGEISIDEMNRLMPEMGHPSLFRDWPFRSCPRIVKNHHAANFMTRGHRVILILRDPRDVVVSYYHYVNGGKNAPAQAQTIKDIIYDPEKGFEGFFRQYYSWPEQDRFLLRYEDLKADPFAEFSRLVHHLNIPASEGQIRQAIASADFSAMRKAQQQSKSMRESFSEGFNFVRSGGSGEWKNLFEAKDIAYWESLKNKYNFKLYP